MGEIVMLLRGIPGRSNAAHIGVWDKSATDSREVRGKTLGIVGYGNIGAQVSVLAEAFGMRVLYFDTIPKLPHGNALAAPSLRALLEGSDIVTLHVPETPATVNLIGADEIALMRRGAILINNSRGKVVDLDALRAAMESGQLGGAAVDVFPEEPESKEQRFSTPLQGLRNVILTPHIGGSHDRGAVAHRGGDVAQARGLLRHRRDARRGELPGSRAAGAPARARASSTSTATTPAPSPR
jgi:D-3-phosphoglycerate dehydrogenase